MPCVVPTCNVSVGTVQQFPQHVSLVERWLKAIQVGCGVKADVAGHSGPMEICHYHFGTTTSDETYQEPKVFYNCNAEKVEIDSCRFCLKFYPVADLVSKDGKQDIRSIIHELLQIRLRPNDFLQLICKECVARLELMKSIKIDFVNMDVAFHKLVETSLGDAAEVNKELTKVPPMVEVIKQEELILESDVGGIDEESISDEFTPQESAVDGLKPLRNAEHRGASLPDIIRRKCYICSMILESPSELAFHLPDKHSNLKDTRCHECSQDFPLLASYNKHLARHDPTERPNKCTFCPLRFNSLRSQMRHENKTHGAKHEISVTDEKKEQVSCEICNRSFAYKSYMRAHMRQQHSNKEKPKCKICGQIFASNLTFTRHMQLHTEKKPYRCDQCDASFQTLRSLKHHVQKVHEGKNPHVCAECKQEFGSVALLYKHKRLVHQNKTDTLKYARPCALCNELFKKAADLQDHISAAHADVDYPYIECPECSKKFITKFALANHKATHTERCFCKECGKRFGTPQTLKNHIASIHEKQLYYCAECPTKTFKSHSAQRSHMIKHNKEKELACEFCDKIFFQKTHWANHRRTHTGEKPYECPYCSKCFRDDGNYFKHKKLCQQEKQEVQVKVECPDFMPN